MGMSEGRCVCARGNGARNATRYLWRRRPRVRAYRGCVVGAAGARTCVGGRGDRGRRELIQLLHSLGGTRLIASHDLELILQTCTRVLLLDRGRLIADGPTRSVLADAALMEAHGLEVPYSLR